MQRFHTRMTKLFCKRKSFVKNRLSLCIKKSTDVYLFHVCDKRLNRWKYFTDRPFWNPMFDRLCFCKMINNKHDEKQSDKKRQGDQWGRDRLIQIGSTNTCKHKHASYQ